MNVTRVPAQPTNTAQPGRDFAEIMLAFFADTFFLGLFFDGETRI
jgi:hypothetical protein